MSMVRSEPDVAVPRRQLRAPDPVDRRSVARSLVVAARPRQWVKNVLVFAAPAAAAELSHPAVLLRAVAALVLLVAASSATYLVNDVLDAPSDRLHPTKRTRPVATGALRAPVALGAGGILAACSLAGALAISDQLVVVVGAYLCITLAYSLGLKRIPVLELAVVASGFVLRAVAGGVAVGVPISTWFLVVITAAALFVVAGKRAAELLELGSASETHRSALGSYPERLLRSARIVAASVAISSYCLWVLERSRELAALHQGDDLIFFELSVIPFVLSLLVVERAVETGSGGAPEELAFHSRSLQVLGLGWVVLVALGIYW